MADAGEQAAVGEADDDFSLEDQSPDASQATSPHPAVDNEEEVRELRSENESLTKQVEELRSELGASRASEEKMRAELSRLRDEASSLRSQAKTLEDRLRDERAAASDRKRKIKSYVESLDVEKARLEADLVELRSKAEVSEKLRAEAEAKAAEHAERARAEAKLRESETTALRAEVEAAKSRVVLMQQVCEQLETHKSKRLTAKSEMVALARVLETERDRAANADRRVREIALPRAVEQVSLLRESIARLDDLNSRLQHGTSGKSEHHQADSGADNNLVISRMHASTTDDDGTKAAAEVKTEPQRRGTKEGKDLVAEALGRLDKESEQVTSGLNLLGMGIDLLEDTIIATRICPRPFAECLDAILGEASTAMRADRSGRLRSPRATSQQYGGSYAKIGHANSTDVDDDVL